MSRFSPHVMRWVLDALTDEFATADQIAKAAQLATCTRADKAERICIALDMPAFSTCSCGT
ncbi:hypothetical protein J2X36_000740 [Methylobacterium sp. BE186]|uniref:hypothetical protein n=1 Tax=Methylobacterium sp. BE186 TaxID=2817715 RepID=UPI002855F54E|nr:hypothetical protein [Methylobacterium sp. BE186]MDR7036004.1 hypothetical protein [Methylobacterium sp. BE186]